MPLIADRSVEEVRAAADLVELVRGRVQLVRRGGRWWGPCPFHDERTPSFCLIPPDNAHYYCHGCGVSGDAITWMQEQEGASGFAEAIEGLADRFGITLSYQEESPAERAAREAAAQRRDLLERAARFFVENLWRGEEAAQAREYLKERGFDEELCRRFRVGYAPAGSGTLVARALREGYSPDALAEAGLARIRGRSAVDFFSARIMFPIADAQGRVKGFGGRTLDPNERAKYVNSPETDAFRKRRLLFALSSARTAAARAGYIVVAEGYTDVMGLAKVGVDAAVACMGTSLTPDQLRLLARSTSEVRLCFDADAAGVEAAWRTVEAASGIPLRLSAVRLPEGRDPGDLAGTEEGRAELLGLIESSEPLLTCLIRSRAARAENSPRARDDAVVDIGRLLQRFPDSVEKDEGVRLAAGLLQLSRGMEEQLRSGALAVPAVRGDAPPAAPEPSRRPAGRERRLLALALAAPDDRAREVLQSLPEAAFAEPAHREVAQRLRQGVPVEEWPEESGRLVIELRAQLAAEPGSGPDELDEAALRLQEELLQGRAHALREKGDEAGLLKVLDLLTKVRERLRGDA